MSRSRNHIAIYRGTTDDDGDFVGDVYHPGKKRHRYRVDLFIQTGNGDVLKDEISTKDKVRLNDLLEDCIKPSIDDLIAEADQHGGTARYGFDIFKWR